jgi:copper chaperone CopZ
MSKQSAYFRVPDLSQSHDPKELKKAVDSIRGVISVSVNASTNKVSVDYDSTGTTCDAIKSTIEKSGFEAQLLKNQDLTM